jgi:hypothetical protein
MSYGKIAPKLPGWKLDNRIFLGVFFPGAQTTASQIVFQWVFAIRTRLPANFREAQWYNKTNATGSTVFIVNQISGGTTTQIGTITVSTAGVATFATTLPTDIWFATSDVLQVLGPASADATLADFCFTFAATA